MVTEEFVSMQPFFKGLDQQEIKAIARMAEELEYAAGVTVSEEGQPVKAFYLLMEGKVELFYKSDNGKPEHFIVGEIHPGEPFGISALIEPYTLTATARSASPSRVLKFDAVELRKLCQADHHIGHHVMTKVAKAAMDRLHFVFNL